MLVDNRDRPHYDDGYVYYCDDALRIDRGVVRYRPIFIDIYTEIKDWCARLQPISRDKIILVVDDGHPRYAREGRFDYRIYVGLKFAIDLQFAEIDSFQSVSDYIGTVINEYIRAIDTHVQQYNSTLWRDIHPSPPTWSLGAWNDENRSTYPGASPYRVDTDWPYGTVVSVTSKPVENEKAKKLLWSCLSRKQKKMYKQDKTFIAIGNVTGTKYLIRNQTQINIVQLDDDGNWVEKLCTVPTERIPVEDHQLAQKLMIETEEDVFLDKVIRWSI